MSKVGQEIIGMLDELIVKMQQTKNEISEKMKEVGLENNNDEE